MATMKNLARRGKAKKRAVDDGVARVPRMTPGGASAESKSGSAGRGQGIFSLAVPS